ncbi:MAG: relaxase/mobilization nuclease domain-containing protein [Verrucomicrobiota bacterium]
MGWTQTLNMLTDNPAKAWKVMAYTAKLAERLKEASGVAKTGRKLRLPVFSYSLSWHPSEHPSKEDMLRAVHRSIKAIGMEDYEGLVVAHTDTLHSHVHIALNRVHPITGLTADNGQTKRKLSAFALKWEQDNGIIHCPQRKENHDMRKEGKTTKYNDPIIAKAWERSNNGREFISELERHEYYLARGRKRLVVVDTYGKIHSPTRHLNQVNIKTFEQKLEDLDFTRLRDAEDLSKAIVEFKKLDYNKRQKAFASDDASEEIVETNQQPPQSESSRLEQELETLSKDETHQALRLKQAFEAVILQRRKTLEKDRGLSIFQTEINKLKTKNKLSGFLQKAFGLHSYRHLKLKSLRRKFSTACIAIEKDILPYRYKMKEALQQNKDLYEYRRAELLAKFSKCAARINSVDPNLGHKSLKLE